MVCQPHPVTQTYFRNSVIAACCLALQTLALVFTASGPPERLCQLLSAVGSEHRHPFDVLRTLENIWEEAGKYGPPPPSLLKESWILKGIRLAVATRNRLIEDSKQTCWKLIVEGAVREWGDSGAARGKILSLVSTIAAKIITKNTFQKELFWRN